MAARISSSKLKVKTKRLILRPYRLSDFEGWKTSCERRRPKQNKFERSVPKHLVIRTGFEKWLKARKKLQEKDLVYVLGIFNRDTGENIGTIDFSIIRRLSLQWANLGYAIHNHLWGRGYAKEATRASLDIAFDVLKVHRVEAAVDPGNLASIKVAKGIGMAKECKRRQFIYDLGQWHDCFIFVMTSEMRGIKKMKPAINTSITDYL